MKSPQGRLDMDRGIDTVITGRKRPAGVSTTDLILSAHVGNNADVFPHILQLHVDEGATIADVTYGKGVFWRKVDTSKYDFHPSDIATGIDCRDLPYESGSLDAVVLDPPYMEGFTAAETLSRRGREPTAPFESITQTGMRRRSRAAESGMLPLWNFMKKAAKRRIERCATAAR